MACVRVHHLQTALKDMLVPALVITVVRLLAIHMGSWLGCYVTGTLTEHRRVFWASMVTQVRAFLGLGACVQEPAAASAGLFRRTGRRERSRRGSWGGAGVRGRRGARVSAGRLFWRGCVSAPAQAGVALGLARLAGARFPDWGPHFQTYMVRLSLLLTVLVPCGTARPLAAAAVAARRWCRSSAQSELACAARPPALRLAAGVSAVAAQKGRGASEKGKPACPFLPCPLFCRWPSSCSTC